MAGNEIASAGETVERMRRQRNFACAAAVLALGLGLSLLTANFPGDRRLLEEARAEIVVHEKLEADLEKAIQANQDALQQNLKVLAELKSRER